MIESKASTQLEDHVISLQGISLDDIKQFFSDIENIDKEVKEILNTFKKDDLQFGKFYIDNIKRYEV